MSGAALTYGHMAELVLALPRSDRRLLGRFLSDIEVDENGCWIFQGQLTHNGYGRFWNGTANEIAHRFSYRSFKFPIPAGLQLDHLCRVRACSNPDHLEPVTAALNTQRAVAYLTRCPSGHRYTEENTRWYRGRRYCRACNKGGGEGRATLGIRGGVPLSSNARRRALA